MENQSGRWNGGVAEARGTFTGKSVSLLFPLLILIILLGGCFAVIVQNLPENQPEGSLTQLAYAAELDGRGFVHVKARARVLSDGGFGTVAPEGELTPVELLRTTNPSQTWSVTCNSKALIGGNWDQYYLQLDSKPPLPLQCGTSICRPQVGFVGCFLWGATLIDMEESRVCQQGLIATREQWTDSSGDRMLTLNIRPSSRHNSSTVWPGGRCHWFDLRNSKRYVFNLETGRLQSACVYLLDDGHEIVLFQTDQIEYLNEIDGQSVRDELLAKAGL